jgi:hypothetical protein
MSKADQSLNQTLQAPYPSNEDDLLTSKFRHLLADATEFV